MAKDSINPVVGFQSDVTSITEAENRDSIDSRSSILSILPTKVVLGKSGDGDADATPPTRKTGASIIREITNAILETDRSNLDIFSNNPFCY